MVPVAAARGELQWLSGDEPGAAAEASAVIEKARKAREKMERLLNSEF